MAALIALMLPACGSSTRASSNPPKHTASTKPAPPRTTIGTLPVITETTVTVPATVAPGPTGSAPANSAPTWFQTPTGNIGCRVEGDSIRCDIRQAHKAVAKAADCATPSTTRNRTRGASTVPQRTGLPSFKVTSNGTKGEATCDSESVMGGEKVRRYPARASVGSNVCDITSDGVDCRNGEGHGFFLSKESYRLF